MQCLTTSGIPTEGRKDFMHAGGLPRAQGEMDTTWKRPSGVADGYPYRSLNACLALK